MVSVEKSHELHQTVNAKLLANPELVISRALSNISRWESNSKYISPWLIEWRSIFHEGVDAIVTVYEWMGTCIFDIDDDKNIIDDVWSAEQFNTPVQLALVANQKFVCRERVPCGEYLIRDYEIEPKLDEFVTNDLFDS